MSVTGKSDRSSTGTTSRRAEFASMGALRDTMGAYYGSLRAAVEERTAPVAWCSSVGPAELLTALGFVVYFPENHAAMLGASRTANRYLPLAHAQGYSPDVCSYLASDIGAYLAGETPLSAFGMSAPPRPDVLVFNTNQCRDVREWFSWYARELNVPLVGITSPRSVDEVTAIEVDSVTRQLDALVAPLEAVAGVRLDATRL